MPSAMILAAGRGERLRPLTDSTPKALLEVAGVPLIVRHLRALREAGIEDVVINLSYLGDHIRYALGDGRKFGVRILYSPEPTPPLETGGGIRQALPLLKADPPHPLMKSDPFWVVNADVCTDYRFATPPLADSDDAHLVLVDNPAHHPEGDFYYEEGRVQEQSGERLTFAGIGFYRSSLIFSHLHKNVDRIVGAGFSHIFPRGAQKIFDEKIGKRFPLAPLLKTAIRAEQASGEHFRGQWMDIGTAERLAEAQTRFGPSETG